MGGEHVRGHLRRQQRKHAGTDKTVAYGGTYGAIRPCRFTSSAIPLNKSDWDIDWTKYGNYGKSSKELSLDLSYLRAAYYGVLEVSFDVGEANNGKIVTVYHKSAFTGEIEELSGVVTNGKVTVNVDSLSPFLVLTPSHSGGTGIDNIALWAIIIACFAAFFIWGIDMTNRKGDGE